MTKRKCADCYWFEECEELLPVAAGRCRLLPPQIKFGERGIWPVVKNEDWCGEFEPKAHSLESQ